MAISSNQLIQALTDAGINNQAQATRLFRVLLQMTFLFRQNELANKVMSGTALTAAEQAEMASNEAALANLAQLL